MNEIYVKSQVYQERRILAINIEDNGYLHDWKMNHSLDIVFYNIKWYTTIIESLAIARNEQVC